MSSMGLFYDKEAMARVISQMPRISMGEYKGVVVSDQRIACVWVIGIKG